MDRSLDEIAEEMNSNQGSSTLPFGQDYEEREYVGAPIRGSSLSSRNWRRAPYSTSRGGHDRSERDRSHEDDNGSNRIFVANLSYSTTWQRLKDYMRKGIKFAHLIE